MEGRTLPLGGTSNRGRRRSGDLLTVLMVVATMSSIGRSSRPLWVAAFRTPCFAARARSRVGPSLVARPLSDAPANGGDRARIVFLGTPDVAADSLRTMVEESKKDECVFEVVGVVTQPPKRRKRRGKVVPSPVGLVAEELGIPVLSPEKAKDAEFLDELEFSVRPDMCITAAYGQYLPKRFLAIPKLGTLNIHPSLLPRWRGASPVQRSLEAGDDPLGVSVLFTVSKMDAGPIVSQEVVRFSENDRADTVLPELFRIGTARLLDEAVPRVVSGEVTMTSGSTPQDEDGVVAASMIDSAEGELRAWSETARTCHNKVRGFAMWPGTFMYLEVAGEDDDPTMVKVKVVETRVAGETGSAEPTNAVHIPRKGAGLEVVCFDGSVLEIVRIQPITKKVMDAKSFVNGLRGRSLRWVTTPEEKE